MNQNRYRIVFNRARGQLMAVAETASGHSHGGSSGERASSAAAGQTSWCWAAVRSTALATWVGVGAISSAMAQIAADPSAPANQRPTVLVDSAGRPLVNIQTPSAGGVSRNTYRQFDVGSNGVVLNNSRASNPWLAAGEAKVILNEVNSTNPSYLRGAITVNGATAQVIVANPRGLVVDGASFVNASRAVLTTGTANMLNGQLTGITVREGNVWVQGNGLNNSNTPYTDILARAAIITGRLNGQEVNLVTGAQNIDWLTGALTSTTGAGAKPVLSIDTSSLGGMYANSINILATEDGVGVRNQGTLQASGQLVVTVDGLLQNLGTARAGVISLATVKGQVENAGQLQASQALVVSSGGDARFFGAGTNQTAASSVIVSAKGRVDLFNNSAYGAAQIRSDAAGGRVSISAGQHVVLNSGTQVSAAGDVQVAADGQIATFAGSSVRSTQGDATLLGGKGMWADSTTVTGRNVHLETGEVFSDSTAALSISGGQIRGQQQTAVMASGALAISSPGAAAVSGAGHVHLQGQTVTVGAGSSVQAGQNMTVAATGALTLQASSGTTASNGQVTALSAGGNLVVSGGTVAGAGTQMNAGRDLIVEATEGHLSLHGLANAGGSSIQRSTLNSGGDLNISAYKGAFYATALQATGQNVNIASNGIASVANATQVSGSNSTVVASQITARDDLTIASVNPGVGSTSQVQLVGSSLNAASQVRLISSGNVVLTDAVSTTNGVNTPTRASVLGGSVVAQGGMVIFQGADVRTNGNKSSATKSGDIRINATDTTATMGVRNGFRTQLNATGHVQVHAKGNLSHDQTQINAGGSHSSTSATGQITSFNAHVVAKDMLSFASKGAQTHSQGFISGGAASVFNETGHLALNNTRVQAVGTTTAGFAEVSGQTSIESGGTFALDAASVLVGTTDLSIVQGQGNIVINPTSAARGTLAWSQIGANRNLTLATRNGNMTFTGNAGSNGVGSSSNVFWSVRGDLNLIANNIHLQGSRLQTGGALNLTATTGNLNANALQVTQTAAGFTNYYWDRVQLVGSRGVNIRAAGSIGMTSVLAQSNGVVNIQSGGNTTIAGNYARWTVDNRPSAGSSYNGWLQDEKYVWQSFISGNAGVNVEAMGGDLTLNATALTASNGRASLAALGSINLEAAQEHKLHQASSTNTRWQWKGLKSGYVTETTYHHREYLTNKPVTVSAQDIVIKAGSNLNTFGTKLNASRNLNLQAGDEINYFAVYDQQDVTDTTHSKLSSWGLVTTSRHTTVDTTKKLSGQPTVLQSQQNILSQSGGNQLLQGTYVSYGSSASFQTRVGEKARADARIILEGIKNSVFEQRTKDANYVVWQKKIDQGSFTETLVMPSFHGPKAPEFKGPVLAQIPAGEFKTQIQILSQQPGMGYLNALAARSDVNWQPVQLAFNQWNYKQEGLTPAGAALLAAAVAWAMPAGAGANLLGTTGATTSAMANAAFMSLASTAAITFVNNKGNIGKTLEALAKSETVKGIIAAALTAGVMDKLGATATMKDLSAKTGFSDKLTYNLINAGGRALTNTAINGGDLKDALKQALIGGLVDTAHGQVASKIGEAGLDYISHKLAHALAGCVAGAAVNGTCRDGAIGGAVGEIVAEMFKGKVPAWTASDAEWAAFDKQVKDYGKLVAGAVSAYAGGNAQTAITTAEVAIDNNARMAFRVQAMQQSVSPQQLWINMRVQSLQTAVRESGGTVTGNVTVPGARVNYTQSDIARLETQLKGLSPNHQLIYSQPNSNLSPMPAAYVNMRTAVNMDNVVGASGTNAFGFNRDSSAYFRLLMQQQPQMFSARNVERINNREAPQVDSQWVQFNPTHQSFLNSRLVHHHWMQGNTAVAIPEPVHQAWNRTFHPYR